MDLPGPRNDGGLETPAIDGSQKRKQISQATADCLCIESGPRHRIVLSIAFLSFSIGFVLRG